MLTGDSQTTAEAIARKLGIREFEAEVLPERKAEVIQRLQQQGRVVAMAGDGINDAPALAQAQVGIAMGTGTDIAMHSSGITLLRGDLRGILRARRLSQATMRNIRQNLFFAFIYNAAGGAARRRRALSLHRMDAAPGVRRRRHEPQLRLCHHQRAAAEQCKAIEEPKRKAQSRRSKSGPDTKGQSEMAAQQTFYGWKLVAVLFFLYVLNLGFPLYGGLILHSYMVQKIAMNRATFGLGMTVFSIVMGVMSPLSAAVITRWSIRVTLLIGTVLLVLGSLVMANTTQPWQYILGFGVSWAPVLASALP